MAMAAIRAMAATTAMAATACRLISVPLAVLLAAGSVAGIALLAAAAVAVIALPSAICNAVAAFGAQADRISPPRTRTWQLSQLQALSSPL